MVKETTDIIYTIIDIETTGGKFNEEKITEIAIFKLSKNGNISKCHKLINPEKKIQPFVEKLTGLNNKMLENKPVFSEIAEEINSFTKGCVFVAHNVKFDYRVLKKEFSRIGIKFQRDLLCTIELSKIVFPDNTEQTRAEKVLNVHFNKNSIKILSTYWLYVFNETPSN